MKSTKNDKKPFLMTDFEKGLMLAGIIAPKSAEEMNEIRKLEEYDKNLAEQKKKTYFKRVVLAAEIANELHTEPTFGRIKFQKMMYLCEHAAHMNLHHRYVKQSAGPFDNKFMHTIETEFKRNKWFEVEKISSGNITRTVYKPLSNLGKYKEYYESIFKLELQQVKNVIGLFRTAKSDFTEVAATLHACHTNLKSEKGPYTLDELTRQFYAWSEKKAQYDLNFVMSTWNWLKDKGLVD